MLIQGSDPPKDYSAIIEELQSHRKEIEKLQSELQTVAAAAQSKKGQILNIGRPFMTSRSN